MTSLLIKPCPHCGGRGIIKGAGRDHVAVVCTSCGSRGARVKVSRCGSTELAEEYAVYQWNKRSK